MTQETSTFLPLKSRRSGERFSLHDEKPPKAQAAAKRSGTKDWQNTCTPYMQVFALLERGRRQYAAHRRSKPHPPG